MSRLAALLIVILTLSLLLPADAGAEFALPADFDDQEVVVGVGSPTAIDWLPNGNLLIASKEGNLRRWEQSGTSSDVVLNLTNTVCSGGEMGLLGVAVDPNFDAGEPFVYLYYTDQKGGGGCGPSNRANRVSRFETDADGNVDEDSEQVLIDNISARGGNHNGGDLQFDKDGLLYVSVGDAGQDLISGQGQDNNRNARRLSLLNGKILRIETDGSIPAGNPFTGNNTRPCAGSGGIAVSGEQVKAEKKGKHKKKNKKKKRRQKRKRRQLRNADTCQEIFATGLRNPFRIAFDPDDTSGAQRFYINDVGGGAWEEIDEGEAGADYGWNVREGPCPTGQSNNCSPSSQFKEPFFAYPHSTGCRTITGGAFVPDTSGWPDEYHDMYLYADFICDTLFAIPDAGNVEEPEVFGTGTAATHLRFHSNGNDLYYTTFDSGGEVRRIIPPP